jgi:hypothetical protein
VNKERTQDIRDELLIEMARGIQFLLAKDDAELFNLPRRMTIIGRIDSHVAMLRSAEK